MALALGGSDQLLNWDRPTQHLCTQVLNIPEPGIGIAWPGGLAFGHSTTSLLKLRLCA